MRSLPSRLVLGVFSTVLVTSLAVAFTAARSTESFLRAEIDQRFPMILAQVSKRLELWYDQRRLDIRTFAHSTIVRDHLEVLARTTRGQRAERARSELRTYLEYVLERFPQYDALFLLSRDGERLLWVGDAIALPNSLQETLREPGPPRVSALERVAGTRSQVASAPVPGAKGQPLGSLHAVLALEELDALIAADDPDAAYHVAVVGGDGEILAPARDDERPDASGLARPDVGRVAELTLAGGERVIASAEPFARFGWTLWVTEPYDAAFAPLVAMIRRVWAVNLAIVLLLGGVAYSIARSLARPIHDLSQAAREIAEGSENVAIPVFDRADEVGVLSRALREMTARLHAKHGELQRANEVLTQLSITDGLTSLHNHRAFQDRMARDVRRARRTQVPLCLALFDVDDFKKLNDRHGHAAGDRLLAAVADVLRKGIRETDFAARYGGEEFALLLSVPLDGALTVAENLRRSIAAISVELDDAGSVGVTVSVGVAELRSDAEALFTAADRALYGAKHSGKDCVIADPA